MTPARSILLGWRSWAVVPLVLGLLGVAGACGGDGVAPGSVARIGDRHLDYAAFSAYVAEVTGERGDALESAVLAGLFEQFVEEELLLELARDRGLVGPRASRRDAAAALIGPGELQISEPELQRYYADHAAELVAPERVLLLHLLFEERAAAERAQARLGAGEDPHQVADDLGALGIEQVEVARADLPPDYADTVYALEPGGVALVGDGFQHHVFVAVARRPAGLPALQEVAPDLRRRLVAERARTRRAELLAEARRRYNVRIAEARLPFALTPAPERTTPPAAEGSER
jgi:parvulin-like peptidyl-prolyl isomerase